jgi:hypothetical protein
MFLKLTTGISLIATSLTGAAVVNTQAGDTLYPIKAEVQQVIESQFDAKANMNTEAQTNQNSFLKII